MSTTRVTMADPATGRFVKNFPSVSEGAKFARINASGISACINGRQMTAGGWKWYAPKRG